MDVLGVLGVLALKMLYYGGRLMFAAATHFRGGRALRSGCIAVSRLLKKLLQNLISPLCCFDFGFSG